MPPTLPGEDSFTRLELIELLQLPPRVMSRIRDMQHGLRGAANATSLPWGAALLLLIWAAFGKVLGLPTGAALTLVCSVFLVGFVFHLWRAQTELPRPSRIGLIGCAAAVSVVGWGGLSIIWSIVPDESWTEFNRLAQAVLFFAVGFLVAHIGCNERAVTSGARTIVVTCSLIVVWALVEHTIVTDDQTADPSRLTQPVGHANGLAVFAGTLVIASAVLTLTEPRWRRILGSVLATASSLVLILTLSRSVIAATTVAWLVVVLRVRPSIMEWPRLVTPLVLGVGTASWALMDTTPARTYAGATALSPHDGPIFGFVVFLVVAVALAIGFRGGVGRTSTQKRAEVGFQKSVRVKLVVAAVVLIGGAWILAQGLFESRPECPSNVSRLVTLCTNSRTQWWNEATQIFVANPVLGTGLNTFSTARRPIREDGRGVSQPHNVILQAVADLGTPGGVIVLVFSGAVLVACIRRCRSRPSWAQSVLGSLLAIFGIASLVDVASDIQPVSVTALFAAGVALAADAGGRSPIRPFSVGVLSLAASITLALALTWSAASPEIASDHVSHAYELIDEGHGDEAAQVASRARRWNPLSLDALLVSGAAAEAAGDIEQARRWYRSATRAQPRNPATWVALGIFESAQRPPRLCSAWMALNNAWTLDPGSTFWTHGGLLDRARDAVNKGACERDYKR